MRLEPWPMRGELFRADIVLLAGHGPADGSVHDEKDLAPVDCDNPAGDDVQGRSDMRDLGIFPAGKGVRPERILASQWCSNRQPFEAMMEGVKIVDPHYAESITTKTEPAANLLLAQRGTENVTGLREIISARDGGRGANPLLILDPKCDNRVFGYLRLQSASTGEGHLRMPPIIYRPMDNGRDRVARCAALPGR